MTLEEDKKIYENLDFKAINKKVTESMMDILKFPGAESGHLLYHNIKERFTTDEMAFLTSVHVAESLKDILTKFKDNPAEFLEELMKK
jgi:hypothetical protein